MSELGQKGEIWEWEGGGVLARLMGDAVWGGRLVVCPRVSKRGLLRERELGVAGKLASLSDVIGCWRLTDNLDAPANI